MSEKKDTRVVLTLEVKGLLYDMKYTISPRRGVQLNLALKFKIKMHEKLLSVALMPPRLGTS